MNRTFFILICGCMMCAAIVKVQAQNGNIDKQSSVNESVRTWIITPQTRFTNTIGSSGSHHYMISYKDGNLYFRIIDRNSKYSKNELVLKNVKAIYGSPHYRDTRFAIQNDGTLWAWGNNEYGQVGDNTGINKDTPVKILDNVRNVTVHEDYVFAVKNDGTVYAWGGSRYAKKDKARFAPEKLSIENVSYVYANGNTVSAITLSGDVYQWQTNSRNVPHKVPDKGTKPLWGKRQLLGSNSNIVIQQSDSRRGSYITKNGDLFSWGDVTGNGTNIPVPKDNPVLVLQNVKQMCHDNSGWSGSKTYRYALCADGKLYTVDIEKTFKYILVASNVYLLITDPNMSSVSSGTISYYTNDGCIYKYSYGRKPERTYYDVALPQIKDDASIIEYSPDGYIQDIGNYFGISDVSVLIYACLIFAIFAILFILFPKFRNVILIILGIVVAIVAIVAVVYVIIYVIAIIIIILWLLGGGLGRQWNRDH